MNGSNEPAYIVTKSYASNTWFPLRKPLLFWRDMDFLKERVVAMGSENSFSTPPLSQAKKTPQQSYKFNLWHILVE